MIVKCLQTDKEFRALGVEWNGLLHNSEINTVFLTWEWLFTWWKHFGDGKKLFILIVRDKVGELLGIAPLCIKKVEVYYLMSLNTLTFLGDEEICSDYLDFILCKEKSNKVLRVIFEYLYSHSNLWDIAFLNDLPETSKSLKYAKDILESKKVYNFLREAEKCPYITLPDNFETYIQGLSKNMRYNFKRRMKNLENKYNVKFNIWSKSNNLEKAMESLFDLHRKRREMIGSEGDFSKKKLLAFHKEIAHKFNEIGVLRIYYMSFKRKPVSMLYGFRYDNKFFYFQSGMEPDYEKKSVGLVLMGLCIKDSIDNKLKEFDFLRGFETYKFKWTQSYRKTFNLAFSSDSMKGRLFIVTNSLFHAVKDVLKRRVFSKVS